MPRTATALPPELEPAFAYHQGVAHGVSTRRMRHRSLAMPTVGLRVPAGQDFTVAERAAALLLVLPGKRIAFSHTTAAQLLHLPVPSDERLHVTVSADTMVRRRGVQMHHSIESRDIRMTDGLPVTAPVDTWLDLAATLSIAQLVTVGDAIVHRAPHLLTAFHPAVRAATGRRGVTAARTAAQLIRPGVLSPQETLWRLRFRDFQLPEPQLNVDVHDEMGRWLGCVDFLWRECRVIAEYDGDYHFTVAQRRTDQTRRRAIRDAGWTLIELNGADNHAPGPCLRSIAHALELGDPDR